MQIREQGNKIQLIVATYHPSTKRYTSQVIGSFDAKLANRHHPDGGQSLVTHECWSALSHDDREKLRNHLEARYRAVRAQDVELFIKYPAALKAMADAVADARALGHGELLDRHATEIWDQIARLEKSLKAAGCPRPKKVVARGEALGGEKQEAPPGEVLATVETPAAEAGDTGQSDVAPGSNNG